MDINVLDILIDRIEIILDKEIDFRWKWIKKLWNRLITKISKSSDKEIELNKIKSSINGCVLWINMK